MGDCVWTGSDMAVFPSSRQRAAFCFGRRPEENSASAVAAQERLKVRSSFRRFLYSFPLRRTLYFQRPGLANPVPHTYRLGKQRAE